MLSFSPRLDILPPAQRRLWPALAAVPLGFVLYGGTGIALRLGHRQSIDFDFFCAEPFVGEALQARLPFGIGADVLQKQENTLTLRTAEPDPVKISFFGGLRLTQVEWPDRCEGTGVCVASLHDLLATKLNVLFQRAEAKDYLDVHALLQGDAGLTLANGLGCARAVYGPGFNVALPLKALTYFADGDLPTIPVAVQQSLRDAVRAVSDIPAISPCATRISLKS